MTRRPIDLIAITRWNYANQRARDDYEAHPSEFAGPEYCSTCSRIPRLHNGCETCEARLRMRRRRAA